MSVAIHSRFLIFALWNLLPFFWGGAQNFSILTINKTANLSRVTFPLYPVNFPFITLESNWHQWRYVVFSLYY